MGEERSSALRIEELAFVIQQMGNRAQGLEIEDLSGGTSKAASILFPRRHNVYCVRGRKNVAIQEMNEQCRDLVENKRPMWKSWRRTGNVIENKGCCATKAGMLLKREGLAARVMGTWGWINPCKTTRRLQGEIPPLP